MEGCLPWADYSTFLYIPHVAFIRIINILNQFCKYIMQSGARRGGVQKDYIITEEGALKCPQKELRN